MNRIVVLGGAGAMGSIIVRDLAESTDVDEIVIADFNLSNAEKLRDLVGSPKLHAIYANIKERDGLVALLKTASVVINSTPYYFNVEVMEAALEANCNYLDLGGLFHITKKQLELHERFHAKHLLAILGMGAAPGMTNIMAAQGAEELDTVEAIDISVGCVDFAVSDQAFAPPYAIDTLLDEYTKEPMVFEDGSYQSRPPMSGEIMIDFPHPVGVSSAILTLHSEVLTLPMTYKSKGVKRATFRLGLPTDFHNKLKFLVQLGFGDSNKFDEKDLAISPRQFLAKLLDRNLAPSIHSAEQPPPNDCEVLRVDVSGTKAGEPRLIRMESTIYSHPTWKVSCGALDTGVPPSIVAQMIVRREITDSGVLAPESAVPRTRFFEELAKRTIVVNKSSKQSSSLSKA